MSFLLNTIKKYATNGREAVNIVQMAAGLAITDRRNKIETKDVEWVINSGQYPQGLKERLTPCRKLVLPWPCGIRSQCWNAFGS